MVEPRNESTDVTGVRRVDGGRQLLSCAPSDPWSGASPTLASNINLIVRVMVC